jgi:hypothetical protein
MISSLAGKGASPNIAARRQDFVPVLSEAVLVLVIESPPATPRWAADHDYEHEHELGKT